MCLLPDRSLMRVRIPCPRSTLSILRCRHPVTVASIGNLYLDKTGLTQNLRSSAWHTRSDRKRSLAQSTRGTGRLADLNRQLAEVEGYLGGLEDQLSTY